MTEPVRKIIHIDADCFFAAIEMRDDPSLLGRPMAVGGSPDRRGVISTCNYEARAYGIHSAMASATARRLCPDLIIVPGRFEAYREASNGMRDVFANYTDLIEPLSLDEAFLDVTATEAHQGSATLIAEAIRREVNDALGITVSAGVAPNKFIAKIASDWNKPDGLFVVTPKQVEAFVKELSVKKIFGVGKVTAEKMQRMGIETCEDLQGFSVFELVDTFGRFGERLYELCRGIDHRPVRVARERKSLSVEHTYAEDLPDEAACQQKLPSLIEELEARLLKKAVMDHVGKLFVKIKFADFSQTTVERVADELNLELFEDLCREGFYRKELPVRLLGVGVRFNKSYADQVGDQISLFEN